MERLELELRRKLEDKNSDQVRSAGSETVPAGYSDAVADYFRKLSKANNRRWYSASSNTQTRLKAA